MAIRTFALVFGVVYGLIGLIGLFGLLMSPPPPGGPDLAVDSGYGLLLGLFPVNVVHNLIHLAIGIWGVLSYSSLTAARYFSRANAVIFAVLTIMGLFPVLNTTFGLAPLFGNDIWLHALTALVTAYFGWFARAESGEPRAAVS